ncbi:hypothetical protein OO17_07585 [Rhodopseudomonas palustris]|uniref:Twin-arginine translocation pathway signal n=1 Tax=Rhodopseudomonas palustris TaxID=1076 RepID=A0A0D7EYG5_RHOPL|nr:hypothetical protein OO17_07585 [Rhodopseudomonas palustris]
MDSLRHCSFAPRRLATAVLLASVLGVALGLGGCAAIGDSAASAAFVDPAQFNLYDCKRLAATRKVLDQRTADLKGLIDKAKTGTGGTVVAEVAYGNDYINVRAQARLAEQAWRDNKCTDADQAASDAAAAAASAAKPGGPKLGQPGPASPATARRSGR